MGDICSELTTYTCPPRAQSMKHMCAPLQIQNTEMARTELGNLLATEAGGKKYEEVGSAVRVRL